MEYSKIIAISGLPGLYELVNSKTDGAIVRSLEDKSTHFVSSRVHNFSHLESIEVFTAAENVNLSEVLKAMESSNEKLPNEKDASALTNYFKKTYPKLDFDRVYNSDLRKMVKWFSVLKSNQVDFTVTAIPEVTEEKEPETIKAPAKAEAAPAPAPEKPVKVKVEEAAVKNTGKKPAKEKTANEKPVKEKAVKAKPEKKEKKAVKEKETKKEKPVKKAAKKKK